MVGHSKSGDIVTITESLKGAIAIASLTHCGWVAVTFEGFEVGSHPATAFELEYPAV